LVLALRARCLIGLGRYEEAIEDWAALGKAAFDQNESVDFEFAIQFARLVKAHGGENPKHSGAHMVELSLGPDPTAAARAQAAMRLGDIQAVTELLPEIDFAEASQAAKVWLAIDDGAATTTKLAEECSVLALSWLEDPFLVILAGELQRQGHREAAERCLAAVPRDRDLIEQKIFDKQESPYLPVVETDIRAALFCVDGLQAKDGEQRATLMKSARLHEQVPGIVTRISETW
ncbi:MAG: hypothetical protein KDB53_05985, partial [Planctomycetes bacterium]|nr:hypothetical protein [Planctomycetota bacterium]